MNDMVFGGFSVLSPVNVVGKEVHRRDAAKTPTSWQRSVRQVALFALILIHVLLCFMYMFLRFTSPVILQIYLSGYVSSIYLLQEFELHNSKCLA